MMCLHCTILVAIAEYVDTHGQPVPDSSARYVETDAILDAISKVAADFIASIPTDKSRDISLRKLLSGVMSRLNDHANRMVHGSASVPSLGVH